VYRWWLRLGAHERVLCVGGMGWDGMGWDGDRRGDVHVHVLRDAPQRSNFSFLDVCRRGNPGPSPFTRAITVHQSSTHP
jgi:hypothetical protein